MSNTPLKYSAWSLLRGALSGQRHWPAAWRDASPKPSYDIIIVGGGGHGLATAYYLAKNHGITNVAVIERGWIGGGNTGRNTTIVRSNYLFLKARGYTTSRCSCTRACRRRTELQHHAEPTRAGAAGPQPS